MVIGSPFLGGKHCTRTLRQGLWRLFSVSFLIWWFDDTGRSSAPFACANLPMNSSWAPLLPPWLRSSIQPPNPANSTICSCFLQWELHICRGLVGYFAYWHTYRVSYSSMDLGPVLTVHANYRRNRAYPLGWMFLRPVLGVSMNGL